MRIIIVEPNKAAYEKDVTNVYHEIFRTIGGSPLVLFPYEQDESIVIICNDDIQDIAPVNRVIFDDYGEAIDVIAGIFIICATTNDGNFDNLLPEQSKWLLEELSEMSI
ncbi:MAG: DUF3846 domain-containing protein [Oscillospiraceae bacterium]|nr:DUF3846 domain-containing protein [Oscillospiraceae bacterium]